MANVFYSWQSESPPKTNRSLIEKALDTSLKSIAKDATLEVSPRLDKDTQDVPGSPDIAATIFEKIDRSAVFVADVSLINRGEGVRPTPNPNVLVELGYALAKLGWSRVIMVLNEASGPVEDLPFDLNKKRTLVYRSEESDTERAPARDELRKRLDGALRAIFENHKPVAAPPAPSAADRIVTAFETDARDVVSRVTAFMKDLVLQLAALKPPPSKDGRDDEGLVAALAASEPVIAEYGKVVDAIARFGHDDAARAVYRGFDPILLAYEHQGGGSWYDSDYEFHRFIGHEMLVMLIAALVSNERWETVADVLDEKLVVETNQGPANMPFQALSVYLELLAARNQRLNLGKVSLHGELLRERHEREPLKTVSPFAAFVEADFLLFLRAALPPPDGSDGIRWRPWTGYFMNWKVPNFLVRAERKSEAVRIVKAVGLADVETFRHRYASRAENLHAYFRDRLGRFQLAPFDLQKFGSR